MTELYGWIAGAAAIVAAIVGIFLKGRSAGKKTEQAKQTEHDLAAEQKRNDDNMARQKIKDSVASAADDDVRKQLRDKWTKDNH